MTQETFRILMIDDDYDDIIIFGDVLKEHCPGANLTSKQTGELALQFLKETEELPDLIVLDINMYSSNGFEIAAQLKADERLSKVPIVGYTTSNEQSDKNQMIKSGAKDCFTKPYKVHEIITVQQQMISTAAQLSGSARA